MREDVCLKGVSTALNLGSVLLSPTCPEAKDESQAVPMFKTCIFNQINYQQFHIQNVECTQFRKATVIKVNSQKDITATANAINYGAEQKHFCVWVQ